MALETSCGSEIEGQRSDVPTATERLVTNTGEGVHGGRSPLALPQCTEKARSQQDSQIHFLLPAFKTLTPVPLLCRMSPFFCFPNPLPLTHLLFLEASWPASLKELWCYSNCGLEKVLQQDRQASRTEEFLVLQDQDLLQEGKSS